MNPAVNARWISDNPTRARRGLLGMANNGKRHTNTSQFFFTLDRADELTGKHTLFGKITGNTIYSETSGHPTSIG